MSHKFRLVVVTLNVGRVHHHVRPRESLPRHVGVGLLALPSRQYLLSRLCLLFPSIALFLLPLPVSAFQLVLVLVLVLAEVDVFHVDDGSSVYYSVA